MPNSNLILRTLTSPYGDTTLGRVLSHDDLDNNFIYLKGLQINDASIQNNSLVLTKIDGDSISVQLNSVSSGGISIDSDQFITGGTIINNLLVFSSNSGATFTIPLTAYTANRYFTIANFNVNEGVLDLQRSDGLGVELSGFTTYTTSNTGVVTLTAGSATIINSLVTSDSRIILTKQTNATTASVAISAKSIGSFTITSSSGSDTDDVAYMIINTV